MINKIILKNIATYKEKVEFAPKKVNYFYGSNGSGKTTISNLIQNHEQYNESKIEWDNDEKLETLVYNKHFVKENFQNCNSIKGIFTLGKDTKEAKEFIESAKKQKEENKTQMETLKKSLSQINQSINNENNNFKELCWSEKQVGEKNFKAALIGVVGSKDSFMKKCLSEIDNTSDLLDVEILKENYHTIFKENLNKYDNFKQIDFFEIIKLENDEILQKIITGKQNIEIGKLIQKLNNSDWVKQGLEYINNDNDPCPFCQRNMNKDLVDTISDFFDETYENDCQKLKSLKQKYESENNGILLELDKIISSNIEIINTDKLVQLIETLKNTYEYNITLIDEKINAPSKIIELKQLKDTYQEIANVINEFNSKIEENNKILENIDDEKKKLISQIWKYIVSKLQVAINNYKKKIQGLEKGKDNIETKINEYIKKNEELERQIQQKESEVTSVTHTVNEINKILTNFGFSGFRLSEGLEKGTYKIVRNDDSDVKETLSEGEYNFITFLYFYQLLQGSTETTGINKSKIVVIDDPISSLDSNVLFIVSTLVKNIIANCFDNINGIKQVFILTHNVYFHKEVTYRHREGKRKDETYWVVKKANNQSSIKEFNENPIKTTYELLWRELDNISETSAVSILNTLRRILEHYFSIIGGIDYEKYINELEGEEKLIAKSLVAFINDGSHSISDDFSISIGADDIEKYLLVFRKIFDKSGHINHYNMMRRIEQ